MRDEDTLLRTDPTTEWRPISTDVSSGAMRLCDLDVFEPPTLLFWSLGLLPGVSETVTVGDAGVVMVGVAAGFVMLRRGGCCGYRWAGRTVGKAPTWGKEGKGGKEGKVACGLVGETPTTATALTSRDDSSSVLLGCGRKRRKDAKHPRNNDSHNGKGRCSLILTDPRLCLFPNVCVLDADDCTQNDMVIRKRDRQTQSQHGSRLFSAQIRLRSH